MCVSQFCACGTVVSIITTSADELCLQAADPTPFQAQAQPTIAINFFGTLALTEALIPLIRPGGRIVNVSSISGYMNSYAPALQVCALLYHAAQWEMVKTPAAPIGRRPGLSQC